ncbi:MAG: hypothetical protein WCI27_09980 [Candidatus Omnitrophota bacterium]
MRWFMLMVVMALVILMMSVLQTPWLTRVLCRRALSAHAGVVVKGLHIGSQHFSLPGRVEMKDILLELKVNGKPMVLETPGVLVTGLQSLWGGERRILLASEKMHARYDLADAADAGAQFTLTSEGLSGPVTAAEFVWDKINAREVSAFVIIKNSGIEVRAAKMQAYGGRVTGQAVVRTGQLPAYTGEIFVEGCDMARLSDINRELADQLNGAVTGSVKLAGDAVAIKAVDADLMIPAGGKISASLLGALTQYLPQSREKKRLDLLIRNGGKLAMELFSFTMKGGPQGKFSGELKLRSREINLELNIVHDINTDGTLASLAAYGQKFLK